MNDGDLNAAVIAILVQTVDEQLIAQNAAKDSALSVAQANIAAQKAADTRALKLSRNTVFDCHFGDGGGENLRAELFCVVLEELVRIWPAHNQRISQLHEFYLTQQVTSF